MGHTKFDVFLCCKIVGMIIKVIDNRAIAKNQRLW